MSVFNCYAEVTGSPCLPSRRHRARSAPERRSSIASLAAAGQARNESYTLQRRECTTWVLTRHARAGSDSTFETSSGSCAPTSRHGARCTNESVHQMAGDTSSVTLPADAYISRGETRHAIEITLPIPTPRSSDRTMSSCMEQYRTPSPTNRPIPMTTSFRKATTPAIYPCNDAGSLCPVDYRRPPNQTMLLRSLPMLDELTTPARYAFL